MNLALGSRAYYNEVDPHAAQWIRNLITAGVIAPGEVDERSIADVRPDDLRGFTQCHFFAGIAVWSYALRQAGWPDDRAVWTGSCPCQPFSAAGKRGGTTDERHLWPVWFELINTCRPPVIFGEQVASAAIIGKRSVPKVRGGVEAQDGPVWLDALEADLERAQYTCWPVGFPACGIGSPHIRQRLYFAAFNPSSGGGIGLADAGSAGSLPGTHAGVHPEQEGPGSRDEQPERFGSVGQLEHVEGDGRVERRTESGGRSVTERCELGGVADAQYSERGTEREVNTDSYGRNGSGGSGDFDDVAGLRDAEFLGDSPRDGIGSHVRERGSGFRPEEPNRGSEPSGGLVDAGQSGSRGDAGAVPREEAEGQGQWLRTGSESNEPVVTGHVDGPSGLVDAGTQGQSLCEREDLRGARGRSEGGATEQSGCSPSGLAEPDSRERGRVSDAERECLVDGTPRRRFEGDSKSEHDCVTRGLDRGRRPGPVNGFWANADWIFCRDGKWRPIESSDEQMAYGTAIDLGPVRTDREDAEEALTSPLIDGKVFKKGSGHPFAEKSRVGMLRGYGNGLVAGAAIAFIASFLEVQE